VAAGTSFGRVPVARKGLLPASRSKVSDSSVSSMRDTVPTPRLGSDFRILESDAPAAFVGGGWINPRRSISSRVCAEMALIPSSKSTASYVSDACASPSSRGGRRGSSGDTGRAVSAKDSPWTPLASWCWAPSRRSLVRASARFRCRGVDGVFGRMAGEGWKSSGWRRG